MDVLYMMNVTWSNLGDAIKVEAWLLRDLVYVFSRAAKRGHRPREDEMLTLMRAAEIPIPDIMRRSTSSLSNLLDDIFFFKKNLLFIYCANSPPHVRSAPSHFWGTNEAPAADMADAEDGDDHGENGEDAESENGDDDPIVDPADPVVAPGVEAEDLFRFVYGLFWYPISLQKFWPQP